MPVGLACVEAVVFPSAPEFLCLTLPYVTRQTWTGLFKKCLLFVSENIQALSVDWLLNLESLQKKAYDFLEPFERIMVRNEGVEASDNLGAVGCAAGKMLCDYYQQQLSIT